MTIKRFFLPRLAWLFYRVLSFTWRIKIVEDPLLRKRRQRGESTILAHWHGDELAVLHLVRHFHLATMTSTSSDGQIIDFVIQRMGGVTSKGSSTRGAVQALKGLVRLGQRGHPVSMAVDGPKGPIHQVKSGVFEISRLLQAPIFPVGVWCQSSFIFKKSWNKTYLPYPFAKLIIVFNSPIDPIAKGQDPRSSELAHRLACDLDAAKQQAVNFIATPYTEC